MRNITNVIRTAIGQDVLWTISEFFKVIELLRVAGYNVSFWENEENWATLSKHGKLFGYLWHKYPLLMIQESYHIEIVELLKDYSFISYLVTESLDKAEFSLEFNILKDYIDYNTDYNCFSATDLWFNTNGV